MPMTAEDLAIRMGLMEPKRRGGNWGSIILTLINLAITIAAVWWWPCGGLSLWWKIPLSVVGAVISTREGGDVKALILTLITLAIMMAAVWWWPCGGLSLWWKIPLSVVGVIIAIAVGMAND